MPALWLAAADHKLQQRKHHNAGEAFALPALPCAALHCTAFCLLGLVLMRVVPFTDRGYDNERANRVGRRWWVSDDHSID